MNIDIQIFLDAIGFVQGVSLGLLLILLNKRKYKSTFFLGLFLFLLSLNLGHFLSRNLDLIGGFSEIFLLPFNFSWLLLPLFLIYTLQVSVFSNQRVPYWVLLPGLISFLLQLFIFFLPHQTKLNISENPWYDIIFTFIGIFYSLIIAFWNLKLLSQHRVEVQNSFSHLEAKQLQWARDFLIYSMITSGCIHVLYFISPQNFYFKLLFSILTLIAIYWISYHGVTQRNVISILNKEKKFPDKLKKPADATGDKVVSDKFLKEISKQVNDYMINTEVFTNTNLTIVDLAENLKIHPKRISIAINTIQHQNFNSYVNQFRIEKVKKLLKDSSLDNYSIEGMGYEVGFRSKSVFYSAFKKETGTTPIRYKNSNSA